MILWRISTHSDLEGIGGSRQKGRWHTMAVGKRIVYLAEHPAVTLIENLASLRGDPTLFPDSYQLLKVVTRDAASVGELTSRQRNAIHPENSEATQAIGDAWLASGSSALLRVPSMPSPESWNYLLNPLHPDASEVRIEWSKAISYDRLFHLGK